MKFSKLLIGIISCLSLNHAIQAVELDGHIETHYLRFKTTAVKEVSKNGAEFNGGFGILKSTTYGDFYGRLGLWGSVASGQYDGVTETANVLGGYFDLGYDWAFASGWTTGLYLRNVLGSGVNFRYADMEKMKYLIQLSPRIGYRFFKLFKQMDVHLYGQYQHTLNVKDTLQLFGMGLAISTTWGEQRKAKELSPPPPEPTETIDSDVKEEPEVTPEEQPEAPVAVEEPKAEEPKVEEPKAEEPKTEEPKADVSPQSEGIIVAYFEFAEATLSASYKEKLKKVAAILKQHDDKWKKIEAHGHADIVGKGEFTISRRRAQAVKDFLVAEGIAAEKIQVKAYGTTKPIPNIEKEDKRQRRVEMILKDVADNGVLEEITNLMQN